MDLLPGYRYFYGGPIWLIKMFIKSPPEGVGGWGKAIALFLGSILIWPALWFEKVFFSRRIWKQPLDPAPIIILGQARSGTTLLFKLLAGNSNWTYIDGMDLYFPYAPQFFRDRLRPYAQYMVRKLGVKKKHFHDYYLRLTDPLEEDMQYCYCLSPISAYWGIVWAKRAEELINTTILFESQEEKARWQAAYLYGLKRIAYYKPNRKLVLKSPPSLGRISTLLEIFPDAKFVSINRSPVQVFRSLEKLANEVLFAGFSLQEITKKEIRELLIRHYNLLFEKYNNEKHIIPQGNFASITYDELMEQPLETIRTIFQELSLDGWEVFEPELKMAIQRESSYTPNPKVISKEIIDLVNDRLVS